MIRWYKLVITAAVMVFIATGAAAAERADIGCRFEHLGPAPLHLSSGGGATVGSIVVLQTDAPVEGLPPYEWRFGSSSLGSAAPAEGAVPFRLWEEELLRAEGGLEKANLGGFGAVVEFQFTAGNQTGSEIVPLRILSTGIEGVSAPCRGFEIPVSITVGGEYGLTAQISSNGEMTTVGEWVGTFRVVEGGKIEGDGTLTTTVTGSCVWGRATNPMRISGHVEGDTMYVTVVGEDDGSEPETKITETMECVVRSLIELPSFFAGLARFGAMIATNEPCPIQVGTDGGTATCSGVEFRITRVGGG